MFHMTLEDSKGCSNEKGGGKFKNVSHDSGSMRGVVPVDILHALLPDDGVSGGGEPDLAGRVVVLPLVARMSGGRVADPGVAEGAIRRQLAVR